MVPGQLATHMVNDGFGPGPHTRYISVLTEVLNMKGKTIKLRRQPR